MKKKIFAFLLAASMLVQPVSGVATTVKAEETVTYVTNAQLTDNDTAAPAKDDVIPNATQYEYQKQELSAFCHFGPNTFTGVEWGTYYTQADGTEGYKGMSADEVFTLKSDFDAETMISTLKAAGFEKLIVTAKHHDGFCLWDSEYTEFDVTDAGYESEHGDVLADISAACTKYDMDMGLYLSPWDDYAPSYGYKDADGNDTTEENDVLDYNEYYNNQLIEILGNSKYGNNGHFNEVWMDGAKGSGANAQEYDFIQWFATIQQYEGKTAGYPADCMLFGAEAYTTVRWIGNEDGYANEETWAKSNVNYENNTIDSNRTGQHNTYIGYPDGNQWTVPEVDTRITSGWFWGNSKKTPKTVEALGNMYFDSVGHNGVLLLNVPPNNTGTVDEAILERVTEFGENVKETFKTNLAQGASVLATEVRGNDLAYAPANVLDGNDDTYWTVNDGTTTGSLVVDLGETKIFDVVSIEEAIQFGQRINSYKIEYRNGEDDTWKTFEEGVTVGSKRLCRRGFVKGDQLRITVTTSEAVPMITEVGVYKATEAFEVAGSSLPTDLDCYVATTSDKFTFSSGWTNESGDQFVNGTSTWSNANKGGYFEFTFTGTQVFLLGTMDPNHGKADIYIDGEKVDEMNTYAASRALGQIIYQSDTLSAGEHTLKVVCTSSATGVEAAYVLDNNNVGMVGIENSTYSMNENSEMMVKLVRTGGTAGGVTVTISPNAGSAIQDDFDTECISTVTFEEGEMVKEVPVRTSRNYKVTGEQYFTIELETDNKDLVLGLNTLAKVTIKDLDPVSDRISELLTGVDSKVEGSYTAPTWEAYQAAVEAAKAVLADPNATSAELDAVYYALDAAEEALVERSQYTAEDPFVFPAKNGEMKVLEAELSTLYNSGENEAWPLAIATKDWASGGKIVNCLNKGDRIEIPYTTSAPGTYTVEVTYRSGSSTNYLAWYEADGKITSGTVSAGASDSAGANHIATITLEVTEAGAGTLVFAPTDYDSPQLDKFEITATDVTCQHADTVVQGQKDATCKEAGYTGDTVCVYCSEKISTGTVIEKVEHTYKESIAKATTSKAGSTTKTCTVCGVKTSEKIEMIKSVSLSFKKAVYNGKAQKPSVVVKDNAGKTISSKYYTVKYTTGCKKVGKHKVTVTFKGNYKGTVTKYFTINPKATTLTSKKAAKKAISLKWKKQTKEVTGYQIQYTTVKKFNKGIKTTWVKSAKKTSTTLKKLSAKKTYYVRIRTYKTVSGKKYYSAWSTVAKIKTK